MDHRKTSAPPECRCGACRQAVPLADWPETVVCPVCLDYRSAAVTRQCADFCADENGDPPA